jgi:hypothetical protein
MKLLKQAFSNFGAADLLAQASLTNTPTPANPRGNAPGNNGTVGNNIKPMKPEDRQKVSAALNLPVDSEQEVKRYRIVRKDNKLEQKKLEKDYQISRRKEMKVPVLPVSLNKTIKRNKDINSNTEMSPLI